MTAADAAQDLVAREMGELVVHLLETVDVDGGERAVEGAPVQGPGDRPVEAAPVAQAGERIGERLRGEQLVGVAEKVSLGTVGLGLTPDLVDGVAGGD